MEKIKIDLNNKKATRDSLSQALDELADDKRLIVLSADLKKPTKVDKFAINHPNKYIECGIAEANMVGISAGLAQGGFQPICTSFASFLTGRYDIIRVSVAYQNVPVVLVGTHAGLAIGKDGVTQMGLEDISLMKGLPNMTVLNPSTFSQGLNIIRKLIKMNRKNPYYLRLGRQPVYERYENDETNFDKGFNTIGSGKDIAICSTGCVLDECIYARDKLLEKGINSQIIDIFKIGKNFSEELLDCLKKHKLIVTVEDHMVTGGLGSFISDGIQENQLKIRIKRIGVENIFPQSGEPASLYERYGINSSNIVNNSLLLLNNK